MKPVGQTKLSIEGEQRGNCYAACLASLLEVPIWMVPAFEDMQGTWFQRSREWLNRLFRYELGRRAGHRPRKLPQYYIAVGPSPRGTQHAVIYSNGVLVHDPHPDWLDLVAIDYTLHLKRLEV